MPPQQLQHHSALASHPSSGPSTSGQGSEPLSDADLLAYLTAMTAGAAQQQAQLADMEASVAELQRVRQLITRLPDRVRHQAMVPYGKHAFFPGQLIHTNEYMVDLGCGYTLEASAKEAEGVLGRRQQRAEAALAAARQQAEELAARLRALQAPMANEEGDSFMEIRQEYDESEELLRLAREERKRERAREQQQQQAGCVAGSGCSASGGGGGDGGKGQGSGRGEWSKGVGGDEDEEDARIFARLAALEQMEAEEEARGGTAGAGAGDGVGGREGDEQLEASGDGVEERGAKEQRAVASGPDAEPASPSAVDGQVCDGRTGPGAAAAAAASKPAAAKAAPTLKKGFLLSGGSGRGKKAAAGGAAAGTAGALPVGDPAVGAKAAPEARPHSNSVPPNGPTGAAGTGPGSGPGAGSGAGSGDAPRRRRVSFADDPEAGAATPAAIRGGAGGAEHARAAGAAGGLKPALRAGTAVPADRQGQAAASGGSEGSFVGSSKVRSGVGVLAGGPEAEALERGRREAFSGLVVERATEGQGAGGALGGGGEGGLGVVVEAGAGCLRGPPMQGGAAEAPKRVSKFKQQRMGL